ncbi:PadR family transcriptional regulator [Patulibacter defluvii]|uniref:PadR family transcriptional regulator n=1 Tax=Patulibacter defluvii TaxID=3095358 RepID=UPI002A7629E3|nr:PadR family transcriptional regulator [Patulibacter sp. DM4]
MSLSLTSQQAVALGLLEQEPTYAFDLFTRLRNLSIDPDNVRQSTVYNTIRTLEKHALIVPQPRPRSTDGDRRLKIPYSVSDLGRSELDRWMATPPANYEDLRWRIRLCRPDGLVQLIQWVTLAERELLARNGEIAVTPIGGAAPARDAWETLCGMLVDSLERTELAARARWLNEVRAELEELRRHPARGRR